MAPAPQMRVTRAAMMMMGDDEAHRAPMMLRVARVMSMMAPPRFGRGREHHTERNNHTERNADEKRERDGFETPEAHAWTESRHFLLVRQLIDTLFRRRACGGKRHQNITVADVTRTRLPAG
jgi:hypothetical protein